MGARSGEKHDEAEAEEDGQDVELEIAGAAHDYKQMLAKVDFCFGFVFGFQGGWHNEVHVAHWQMSRVCTHSPPRHAGLKSDGFVCPSPWLSASKLRISISISIYIYIYLCTCSCPPSLGSRSSHL